MIEYSTLAEVVKGINKILNHLEKIERQNDRMIRALERKGSNG